MNLLSKLSRTGSSQGVKYGGYAAIITFVVIVGVVVVNLIVGQVNAEVDLTRRSLFTLSDQSINVIETVEQDVVIYVLAGRGQEPTEILAILRQYSQRSPRISLEVIDAEANPGLISTYDPENEGIANGSVIVAGEENFRVIPQRDLFSIDPQRGVTGLTVERRVSNALIYVSTGSTPKIYQTSGHGEVDLTTVPVFPAEIERENYQLETLNLVQADAVPADAAMVLMIRPRSDISEEVARKLRDYLLGGGKAYIAAGGGFLDLPGLNDLLEDFGVEILSGIALEGDGDYYVDNPTQIIPTMNEEQQILEPIIEDNTIVVASSAQVLSLVETRDRELNITELLTTSAAAYFRQDPTIQTPNRAPQDLGGPFPLAVSIELVPFGEMEGDTRLVVTGAPSIVLPVGQFGQYGVLPGNIDFFMNSLAWIQNRTDAISVRPKSLIQFPMQLSATETLVFSGVFVVLIPLILLVAGLVVWLRRRHL